MNRSSALSNQTILATQELLAEGQVLDIVPKVCHTPGMCMVGQASSNARIGTGRFSRTLLNYVTLCGRSLRTKQRLMGPI